MKLKSALSTEAINLHLKGTTKSEIINELLDMLVASGKITDRQSALDAIMERENKMSTGMKDGIALPHGKSKTLPDLVACFGVSDVPVEFNSLDGEPCRIFIMTLSPAEKIGPHLQFLAEVSSILKSAEKREQILAAPDPETAMQIFSE